MNSIDIAIILAYFASMIFLGLYSNKKQKGVDDYYVGGRSMGALKIGALWMAGWIGGSSVIGTSSNAYSLGITGIWYVAAIAGGCIVFAFTMSAPIKRMVQEVREKGLLIDASFGRSTRSVIIMDSGNVVLSALTADAIAERFAEKTEQEDGD